METGVAFLLSRLKRVKKGNCAMLEIKRFNNNFNNNNNNKSKINTTINANLF